MAFDDSRPIDPDTEAQYNIRRRHPDNAQYYERYERDSAAVRTALPCEIDLRYGPGPNETLDLFPCAGPRNPLLVFIHGGFWRALDKRDFSFVVPGFVAAGYSVALINYALAPAVTVATIVEQAARAIAWLHGNAQRLRGDAGRMVLSGHSAGAHLAAMAMRADRLGGGWGIRGAVCLSGVYDLVPLLGASVNALLRLDEAAAAAVSPARLDLPDRLPPMLAMVGGAETDGFIRQTTAFAERWRDHAPGTAVEVVPDLDHYTIMLDFAREDRIVHRASRRFLEAVA